MKFIYVFNYLIILFSILYGFRKGFLREIYCYFFFIFFYFLINIFFWFYYNFFNFYIKRYNFLWFFILIFIFLIFNFLEKYTFMLLKKFFLVLFCFINRVLGVIFGFFRGLIIIYILNNIYILLIKYINFYINKK